MLGTKSSKEISVDTPNRADIVMDIIQKTSSENILGRGSYGTVIKAVYKGQQVAVKILDKSKESKISTLINEANIAGWKHENIIEILKIDSNSAYGMVIMERFPGHCLQFILDRIKIPVYHSICIAMDVTDALTYCHNNQLVHLDVKPQNILIACSNFSNSYKIYYKCKLCDFGSSIKLNIASNKLCNQMMGTVRYMSPEALKKEIVTPAADIYSLGITMWQINTRQYPYSSINSNEVVAYKVVKQNLRPDFEIPPSSTTLLSHHIHKNCLCENFSSTQSLNSIENIQARILTPNKNFANLSPFQRKPERIPFLNLNKKLNTGSYLNSISDKQNENSKFVRSSTPRKDTSKIVIQITSPQNKAPDCDSKRSETEFDLKQVFRDIIIKPKEKLVIVENEYKKLYNLCWESEPEKRPSSMDLKEFLENILQNNFINSIY